MWGLTSNKQPLRPPPPHPNYPFPPVFNAYIMLIFALKKKNIKKGGFSPHLSSWFQHQKLPLRHQYDYDNWLQ